MPYPDAASGNNRVISSEITYLSTNYISIMKHFTAFLTVLLAMSALFLSSCEKESEPDRDKFLGAYSVVDNCPSFGVSNFDISISESAVSNTSVVISNFGGFGVSVTGSVSGNTLNIPQQTVTFQGAALGLSGTGSLSGLSLIISYSFSIGGAGETCSMTCTKR